MLLCYGNIRNVGAWRDLRYATLAVLYRLFYFYAIFVMIILKYFCFLYGCHTRYNY